MALHFFSRLLHLIVFLLLDVQIDGIDRREEKEVKAKRRRKIIER